MREEWAVKGRVVGDELGDSIRFALTGKSVHARMPPEKCGEVLSDFSGVAGLLGPDAGMVVILPETVSMRSAWVKPDLGFEGLQHLQVLVDGDGCELDNRVAFRVGPSGLKVKKDESMRHGGFWHEFKRYSNALNLVG